MDYTPDFHRPSKSTLFLRLTYSAASSKNYFKSLKLRQIKVPPHPCPELVHIPNRTKRLKTNCLPLFFAPECLNNVELMIRYDFPGSLQQSPRAARLA
jgi:hypothetical protein